MLTLRKISDSDRKGWTSSDSKNFVIANERLGCYVYHVAWIKPDGTFCYDQILRAESGGGVFLPINSKGEIGLQKRNRPQTADQNSYAKDFPEIDFGSLGRVSWECPRGFAKTSETGSEAANREAEEETGNPVISSDPLGSVCDNTAFSPHLTTVNVGSVDLSRKSEAITDPNEKMLSGLTFFSEEEIKNLINKGELYCAYTLSAISLYLLNKKQEKTFFQRLFSFFR